MSDQRYDYFLHVAVRTGYSAVLPVSRLPGAGEHVEDWLQEECELARTLDVDAGLLHFDPESLGDLLIATFHRTPKKPKKPGNPTQGKPDPIKALGDAFARHIDQARMNAKPERNSTEDEEPPPNDQGEE